MGFLSGIEIRRRMTTGELQVASLDADVPFDMDLQVTEDSVDLRLAPAGLVLKSSVQQIDYAIDDFESMYDLVYIPASGYLLPPNEVFLTQTLEAVCLPDDLVGLVVTRSSFARLGIMVTCVAPKSPPGMRWAFPLQIINTSRVPIRIYPFIAMAQLMISQMVGDHVGYRGKYQDSYLVAPPLFSKRERENIQNSGPEEGFRTFHIVSRHMLSDLRPVPKPGSENTVNNNTVFYNQWAEMIVASVGGADMGDTYNVGQAGAVGPGAAGNATNYGQVSAQAANVGDIGALAAELSALRNALRRVSSGSAEQDVAIAEIAQAQVAAESGDEDAALGHLRRAGIWALDTSKAIGAAVATAAIKKAMGID